MLGHAWIIFVVFASAGAMFLVLSPAFALKGNTCSECNNSCLAFGASIRTSDPARYPRCLADCRGRMSICLKEASYKNCGSHLVKK